MKKSQLCTRVNRRLIPVKIHYFLFMAALACALPFRTVFAKQLGISATAVGVIFCAVPFLKIVTNPLFGFILDYFKKFRLTLSVIMIFVALSHVTMIFIPPRSTLYQKNMNISELDFFSKIKYNFINETFIDDYHSSFIMHNEYKVEDKLEVQNTIFTCDIICLDSFNDIGIQKENIQNCSKRISFEIKIFVNISRCNMDVNLKSGKMFVATDNVKKPLSDNINKSSAVLLKSWSALDENCSKIDLTHFDSFSENNTRIIEKKYEKENFLNVENISTVSKDEINISYDASHNFLNDRNIKQYYVQHRYKVHNRNTFTNCPCSLEFNCRNKKCYSKTKADDFSENFMEDENEFLSAQFWGLFFLIALSSVMLSAIIFLMDAVCYEMLQDNKDQYGQQRVWGTIGWGVGALAGGYLNQIIRTESGEVDYAPSFLLLTALTFLDLIPICNLKVTELKYSSHIWKDVCFLFSKITIVYNVIIVYVIGALSGFIWNYQFWFMEEIGSSQVLLGLSQTAECIFELPWFLIAGCIIERIGHDHCNNITLLCFGLRYLCFVFMYDPWWTLPAGLFHGPTFGLFYASLTMYAKNEAPPGTEATVQSLLHLFFEGIGVATGSVLGGIGLDKLGSRMTFAYAASVSFLLLFVNILKGIIGSRTKINNKSVSDFAIYSGK